jgi:hypothetical protein
MNRDPASLDRLRDIVQPGPVSWWPPAIGWWILLAAVVTALALISWRAWQSWRANAYRRAALRELQSAADVAEIADILKRTALAAYPRTDVAALSGASWSKWLGNKVRQDVPAQLTDVLTQGVFGTQQESNRTELARFAATWIRDHQTNME